MSIKFVGDLAFTPKTYASFADLFNPTINRCWYPNRNDNHFTVDGWVKFLKALYQRDNLLSHPHQFFSDLWNVAGGTGSISEQTLGKLRTMLSEIPDDKLWYLHFLSVTMRHGPLMCLGYTYQRDRGNTTVFAPATDYFEEQSTQSWSHATTAAKLLTWIDKVANSWQPRIDAVLTRKMHHDSSTGLGAPLYGTLWAMANGRTYVTNRSTDRRMTAVDIAGPDGNAGADGVRLQARPTPYGLELSVTVVVTSTNRAPLYRVLGYSTNPCDMLPWPIRLKNELPTSTLYGVELECATDYEVRQVIDACELPFLLAKSDSSVTGNKPHRYELVTVPMTLRAHKQQWAKFFTKLDYDKFDTSKRTNNGMHVHIDREAFSGPAHIRAMAWFFNNPANRAFMFELSERTQASLQSFTPHFNIPPSMSKVKAFKDAYRLAGGVRGVVNVSKQATVEIRLFKGIVSYASVLKNLEAVDAALEFTRDANLQGLTLAGFMKWLKNTPVNKYGVLKKFIDQLRNMDELLEISTMQDLIFTERDPDKIISIIKKKQVPVTSKTVTALNKIAGKRTFLLDSQTDEISVTQTNKGKVAFLDLELAKRYASVA